MCKAFVDIRRYFAGETRLQSTGCAAHSSATLGTGAVIGIAVGTLLLGMAIMALILLGIPRSITVKHRPIFC